ncbi:MAG: HAD family hydrolase [Burkholderiales bacterium]|nr:HAD family hydrolase [Burkholderiales bacterium]MDE1926682.1 HAD family hydrolase [Burkholderiales bacterium]MDE2158850.1 HAD family hydrolase [Burkholderiales bacterium]MDE2502403.1 HAD family hydrolase [Burkholderiales bacterium]
MTLRVAVWSGPRNISTALMRAFENRPDCAVSDEPLYAAYLAATGIDHPGRDEVVAAGETDWRAVVAQLLGPAPEGRPLWYQKHMTHHLLPAMERDWIHGLSNVLLIRDPAEVVESYLKSRATVAPEDIGLLQQRRLYDELAAAGGRAPPVIDADAFLRAPEVQLRALCGRLGIEFSVRMLHWPAGPRASDGVWAPHWYEAVWRSTGFEPWRERTPHLDAAAQRVADACRPAYEFLRDRRMA